jgi:hypothetical protein
VEVRVRILSKLSVVTVVTTVGLVVFACGGNQDAAQQPTTPQGQQQQPYPQQPYPQQQPQAYPQQQQPQSPPPQQTFPQQQQPQPLPQTSPTPVAPAAPAMATPGPFALPCQNDGACGLARCNTQFQKCAFPCQSAADCNATASCNPMTGLCLPGGH